jgi:PTS system ascorbate-specific IIA component
MAGIVIVAHTPLASALSEFAAHVFGEIPDRVIAIDVPAHEDTKQTQKRVEEAVQIAQGTVGTLILTDIMGATPANVASKVANLPVFTLPINVLTGVNLPMLLRAITHRSESIEELTEKALLGGQQGVLRLRESVKI